MMHHTIYTYLFKILDSHMDIPTSNISITIVTQSSILTTQFPLFPQKRNEWQLNEQADLQGMVYS